MKRRNQIALTDEDSAPTSRAPTIILCTHGPHGYPHAVAMWFVVDDDQTVWMTTYRKSQKVVNIRRDAKVALHVESGVIYDRLKGVLVRGDAEVIDDEDACVRTLVRIHEKMNGALADGGRGCDARPGAKARRAESDTAPRFELGPLEARRRLLSGAQALGGLRRRSTRRSPAPRSIRRRRATRPRQSDLAGNAHAELYGDAILAELLDRLVETNATPVDGKALGGEGSLDIEVGHRSEQLALFSRPGLQLEGACSESFLTCVCAALNARSRFSRPRGVRARARPRCVCRPRPPAPLGKR